MQQTPASKIQFHFLVKDFSLKERTSLKSFIQRIFKKEGRKIDSLKYIFCSDSFLLSINQAFLAHDYYTDILTFDLSDSESQSAEIYISIDRVWANAEIFRCTFKEELCRVIIHGALHLCGYQDKTTSQKNLMRKKEEYYLDLLFQN